MASIHREIAIEARPEAVWDAVRDVGAIHERLAPGFVVNTVLESGGAPRDLTAGSLASRPSSCLRSEGGRSRRRIPPSQLTDISSGGLRTSA